MTGLEVKTMRRGIRLIALVALVPLLGLLPARAEPSEGFHLERRVPASTLAFVGMERIDAWQQRLEATAMGRMMADPEMQAFMAPIQEAAQQMMQGGMMEVPPLVMELLQQMGGLRGQIGVALVSVDVAEERPVLAASLDFGTHVGDFLEFLTRVKREVDPDGQAVKTMEQGGRTWWEADLGPGTPFSLHATTVDTALVLATDRGLLEGMLAGPVEGSLGASEDFLAVQRRAGGGDLGVFVYGNVKAALDAFGGMLPDQGLTIANALGLDTVRAVAYGMAFKGDGFRDTLMVYAPGADHGIVPMLEMKPLTAPRTLDLAPATSFYWSEGSIPFDTLMARLRALVAGIDPDATSQIDGGLAQAGQFLGVDIEKELLAGMQGGYGAYAALPVGGGLFPEVALVIQVKDPASFEGVFDRLAQGIAGAVNEEGDVLASTRTMDYHGIRMHLFELQAARGDDVVPFTPTWALLGDRLVITLVPYSMKEIVLRSQGQASTPGLASKEDFQSLMALRPDDAGYMEYLNLKAGLGLLYDTLVPLLQTAAKPNVMKDMPLPIDWALLPPASRVTKHFRSLASFVTWNEDGLVISMQSPVPLLPVVFVAAGAAAFLGVSRTSMMSEVRMVPGGMDQGGDIEAEMDLELAKIQAEMLVEAVEFHRLAKGQIPDSLDELVKEGLMGSVPQDPWGGSYRLRAEAGSFVVESAGPDRRYGTPDDVLVSK